MIKKHSKMKKYVKRYLTGILVLAMSVGFNWGIHIPDVLETVSAANGENSGTVKLWKSVSYNLEDGGYLVAENCTVTDQYGNLVSLDVNNPVLTIPGDYTVHGVKDDSPYNQRISLYRVGDVNLNGIPGEDADFAALDSMLSGVPLKYKVKCAAEYAADLDNDGKVGIKDHELLYLVVRIPSALDEVLKKYHTPALTYDYLGGDEVMPIIGFYGPYYGPLENGKYYDFLTDDTYRLVKECGINLIDYTVNRVDDGYDGLTYLRKALELAERYGIGYYLGDFRLNPEVSEAARANEEAAVNVETGSPSELTTADIAHLVGAYACYESYLGTNVRDEPYMNQFDSYLDTNLAIYNSQLKFFDWAAKK